MSVPHVEAFSLRTNRDIVLHKAEDIEDDDRDTDGDEECVRHVSHSEVWGHGNKATWEFSVLGAKMCGMGRRTYEICESHRSS